MLGPSVALLYNITKSVKKKDEKMENIFKKLWGNILLFLKPR